MSDPHAASAAESPFSESFFSSHRRPLTALAAGAFVAFFLWMGARDLWAPDEPRYGQICKEMIRDGHVIVLHVNGEPYSDKPPLFFHIVCLVTLAAGWLRGAALTAPEEWMVRLPSALGALAGVALTYRMGLTLLGRRTGFFAAAATGLSFTYAWQARTAQLDMLMSAFSYAAVACWVENEFGARRKPWRTLLFYVFAAAATLSKGPPGAIVPIGGVLLYRCWEQSPRRALWTALTWVAAVLALSFISGNRDTGREALVPERTLFALTGVAVLGLVVGSLIAWRQTIRKIDWPLNLLGLALFAAILLSWVVPLRMLSSRDFAGEVVLSQTVARYLNPNNHRHSPFYYIQTLFTGWFPWSLLAPAAALAALGGNNAMERRPRRFILSWLLFTLGFFTATPGKRDQYLLPCWPAIGLLFGYLFDRAMAGAVPARRLRVANGLLGAILLVAAVVLGLAHAAVVSRSMPAGLQAGIDARIASQFGAHALDGVQGVPIGLLALPLLIGAFGLLTAGLRREQRLECFTIPSFVAIVTWIVLAMFVLPAINPLKSGRAFSEEVNRIWTPGQDVALFDLERELYVFYGEYRSEVVASRKDLAAFFLRPGTQLAIMRDADFDRLQDQIEGSRLAIVAQTKAGDRHVVCATEAPEEAPPGPRTPPTLSAPPTNRAGGDR